MIYLILGLRENKLRQLKHAGVEKRRKGSKDSFSDLNSLADGLDGLLKEQKNQQSQGINALTSKNREKLM